MKKRFLLIILTVFMTVLNMTAYDFEVDGIYYNINGTDATVTYGYSDGGYSGSITIPATVTYNGKTYSITTIGYCAFMDCSGLTSITIPNSVTSIGSNAFHSCYGLTSVTIPNSVKSIGGCAFAYCSGLTSVTIGSSVTSIGEVAFIDCSRLTRITIPNSVTSIGDKTFSGCSGLTSATIGNSVTSIGYEAFYKCSSLTSITIPNSVTSIGSNAFRDCIGLTSISIGNSVSSIGEYAFDGTAWYNNQPDGLVYAGLVAYKYKGTMPAGTSITLANGILGIAASAFSCCYGLTSVTIPNSVTSIGEYAFYYCDRLTSVTIGNSVTSIGHGVFRECTGLTSITIPNSVTSIGHETFSGCSGLTSITIPNSVTSIGYEAFSGCSGLTSVIVDSNNSVYDSREGCNAIIETASNTLITGCKNTVIPNSVTSIGQEAFSGCSGLTIVTIPNSVTTIDFLAFYECEALKSVIIGSSVISIKSGAFAYCNELKDVYCLATNVPTTFSDAFYSSPINSATLHVPVGCAEVYASTAPWSGFGQIVDYALFPDCPEGELCDAALYLYILGIVQGENGMLLPNREAKRAEVAKMSLYGAYYGLANVPAVLPSDNYPSVYSDLQNTTTYYYRPAKALLYLEYGDGVAPFDRDRLAFEPDSTISRVNVLKVLLEAFNIKPDLNNNTNPFPNDADVVALASKNPVKMGYIRRAAELGIITTANANFRPHDKCTRGEIILMLARVMQKTTCHSPQPTDYFEPLNTTLKTIALGLGLPMGNFNHYTKTSFAIDGTVPLNFAHTYNSYNTTLPDVFYGSHTVNNEEVTYQPMGDGWSHSYHSYIKLVGTATSPDARVIVHWGGGSIDVYKSNGSRLVPESLGVYDDCEIDGNGVVITSKSQIKYRFTSLSGGLLYLTSITDRNGNTLTVNYEAGVKGFHRVKSVSDGYRSLTFSYRSGTDLVSQVTDPLNRSIKFSYQLNNLTGRYQLSSFTDAKGQTTNYVYGDTSTAGTSKLLTRIQLPKGNYIENEYDANRRLSQTVSGTGGIPTTQTNVSVTANYSNGGTASTQSTVNVNRNGSLPSSYHYTFNGNNVVTGMTGEEGLYVNSTYGNSTHPELPTAIKSNSTNVSNVTYDANGNVTRITVTGDGTLTTSMTYNSTNDLTSITDPMNNTTSFTYDANGNLTGISAPESVSTSIAYNSKGLPITITNPIGVKTNMEYNTYGNLIKTTLPALGLTTKATYDIASRILTVTDALDRTTTFSYDKNDNLVSETDPASHKTSYAYDSNDNLIKITNAKNGVTTLTYDNATDWLTSVAFAGSTKQYSYNEDGTLNTYTKPDGTSLSYTYDNLGRVTNDGVNNYSYDNKLRLSNITNSWITLFFSYDGFNRITGTSCNGHNNSYSYDKNGNRTSLNGTTYGYDKLNRLTSVSFNDKTITYTYRKDSQLSKVTYPNGMTTTFTYDAVGRLTGKNTKLSNGTVIASYSCTLDKHGNILSQTAKEPYSDMVLSNEDISYTYNSGNRITKAGTTSFTFDANGNTTRRGSESYDWDEQDKLTMAGSTAIYYDPLGLIARYGDIIFTTDPLGIGNVLSDSQSGATYIYGNGLEARVINGAASYYVTDMRGSVVAIVNESGTITHKYQYDEFGKVVQKQEANYNPFQYVGKYGVMCLNDHLYYMRARHYDPTIGRFLSEDPIWSTNLYPYVDNNPITGIDPEGKKGLDIYNGLNKTSEMGEFFSTTSQELSKLNKGVLAGNGKVASKSAGSVAKSTGTTVKNTSTSGKSAVTPAYAPVNTAVGVVKTAQTNDPSYYFQGLEDDFWGAAAAGATASGHPLIGASIYLVHDVDKGIRAGDSSSSLAENYKKAEAAGSETFWIINRVGDMYDSSGVTDMVNSYYMKKYNP